jgi:hypothetical protein
MRVIGASRHTNVEICGVKLNTVVKLVNTAFLLDVDPLIRSPVESVQSKLAVCIKVRPDP